MPPCSWEWQPTPSHLESRTLSVSQRHQQAHRQLLVQLRYDFKSYWPFLSTVQLIFTYFKVLFAYSSFTFFLLDLPLQTSFSQFSLLANAPPRGGTFGVIPLAGTALVPNIYQFPSLNLFHFNLSLLSSPLLSFPFFTSVLLANETYVWSYQYWLLCTHYRLTHYHDTYQTIKNYPSHIWAF